MGIAFWAILASLKGDPEGADSDGKDVPRQKKKVPKVAFYVLGSAIFMSVGLTIMVIPYVRQTLREQRAMSESLKAAQRTSRSRTITRGANTHMGEYGGGVQAGTGPKEGEAGPSDYWKKSLHRAPVSSPATTTTPTATGAASAASSAHSSTAPAGTTADQSKWDEDEDDEFHHPPQGGNDDPGGGFLAIKAFGMATAFTIGSFALGGWVVAKLMGVSSMEEFARSMRSTVPRSTSNAKAKTEAQEVEDKWAEMRLQQFWDEEERESSAERGSR